MVLNTALTEAGLVIKNDEHVDYVVIGLDEQVTYEKLAIATLGVRNGATFISTNLMYQFLKSVVYYLVMVLLQVL